MLGRREIVAAVVAAVVGAIAVVVLAGLDQGSVIEVRVKGEVPGLPSTAELRDGSVFSKGLVLSATGGAAVPRR
jgi:hypothetical protein